MDIMESSRWIQGVLQFLEVNVLELILIGSGVLETFLFISAAS